MRNLMVAVGAALAVAAPALAADLTLRKGEATELTAFNVGKPYWSLQAQCAGVFGAGHAYRLQNGMNPSNEKESGAIMLTTALAQLQKDRGIDRAAAVELVKPEIEVGRAKARSMLEKDGIGAYSSYSYLRSTCLDVAEAYSRRIGA